MKLLIFFMLISINIFSQNNDIIINTIIDTTNNITINTTFDTTRQIINTTENFYIDTLINDTSRIDTILPMSDTITSYRNAADGIFIFETLDTIYVGEPIVVSFSISKDIPIKKVVDALKIKKYKYKKIRIDRKMQITIYNMNPDNLIILPTPKPIEQTMADGRHSPWFWTLKTKSPGKVCFTVEICYMLNKEPQHITYEQYSLISISKATIFENILSFIKEYWQWFFGTFISSIALPIFLVYQNKKKKK